MRKFTLLIASLFITIGAMAQTPVLHYEDITSRQELSSDDANTIRNLGAMTVIADVEITNTSNPSIVLGAVADYTSESATNGNIWALGIGGNGMRYIVRATDGGWYSRGTVSTSTVKLAYTYNYANNQTTVNYYTEGGTSQGSVTVADAALSTFNGENAKFYIGGVGHTNSNGWYSAFAGTINSVDIYEGVLSQEEIAALCQPELPEGFVATPEEFVNGKVYTFETQRGKMGATAESSNVISTAKTTVADTETDYFKWAVYKSENENYYLYNIGKAMFMGVQSTNNASVPFAATPQGKDLTFKTSSSSTYPIMFSTDNAGVVNHSTSYGEGLITWDSGWSVLTDDGSNHMVVEAGDIDPTVLAAIESAVALYEADNTEAVAALDAAIAKAQTLFGQITIGEGLGQYTSTDPDYMTKYESIIAFRESITATNDPTPAEVEAKTAELEAIIASFQLNLPVAGKYYRILAVKDWNDDARYLGAQNSTAKDGRAEFIATADANSIFYFDGENLVSYTSGNYLVSNSNFAGYNGVQTSGTKFAFHAASNNLVGAYNISFNDGNRWLYCHQSNYTDAGGRGTQNGYCFNIEEVTELPVTVTAAGKATLFAPVALTVPADIKAYTVATNGEWAVLTDIGTTIPAETGVVLEAEEGTYNFAITTTDATAESELEGTVASEYVTVDAYVLGIKDEVVAFYTATTDGQADGTFLNNGHKAYLPKPAGSNIAAYSFRFGEGTTGIEQITENREQGTVIYDLTGRRVETITEPGIYIVNGVKKLVR